MLTVRVEVVAASGRLVFEDSSIDIDVGPEDLARMMPEIGSSMRRILQERRKAASEDEVLLTLRRLVSPFTEKPRLLLRLAVQNEAVDADMFNAAAGLAGRHYFPASFAAVTRRARAFGLPRLLQSEVRAGRHVAVVAPELREALSKALTEKPE